AGPAAELIVDAAALVTLGAEDVEAAQRNHFLLVLLAVGFDLFVDLELLVLGQVLVLIEDALEQEIGVAAQQNVRPAAGHVGGDRDGALTAGLCDDFGFLLVVFGVQDVVFDAVLAQVGRQPLRLLDGDR